MCSPASIQRWSIVAQQSINFLAFLGLDMHRNEKVFAYISCGGGDREAVGQKGEICGASEVELLLGHTCEQLVATTTAAIKTLRECEVGHGDV